MVGATTRARYASPMGRESFRVVNTIQGGPSPHWGEVVVYSRSSPPARPPPEGSTSPTICFLMFYTGWLVAGWWNINLILICMEEGANVKPKQMGTYIFVMEYSALHMARARHNASNLWLQHIVKKICKHPMGHIKYMCAHTKWHQKNLDGVPNFKNWHIGA